VNVRAWMHVSSDFGANQRDDLQAVKHGEPRILIREFKTETRGNCIELAYVNSEPVAKNQ
jgi:hypothetical protein